MDNKYKTLIISPLFPPPFIGGSAVYLFNLIENSQSDCTVLTSPISNRHDELIISNKIIKRNYFVGKIKNNPRIYDQFIAYLYFISFLPLTIIKNNYKTIIVNMEVFGNGMVILLSKLFSTKVICLSYAEELSTSLLRYGIKAKIKYYFLKYIYTKASGFISCTDYAKQLLLKIGVDEKKIIVIPPPVSKKMIDLSYNNNKQHKILSVGRLTKRKGFDQLIKSVSLLLKKGLDIKLDIIGNGPELNYLNHLIQKYHMNMSVNIHPNISSDDQLHLFYQNCNIFVLANRYLKNGDCEGSPIVIIEASSFGKPVIGGNNGGTSTAIDNKVTGFLVNTESVKEIAEYIELLIKDKKLSKKMGMAGINKAMKNHNKKIAGMQFDKFLITI